MQTDLSQPTATIKLVRYEPPSRWTFVVIFGATTLISLFFLTQYFAILGLPLTIFLIAVVAFSLFSLYDNVWFVETRNEGLFVQYMLRNTKLIPWREIRQVALRWTRLGRVMRLYGDNRLLPKVSFMVSMTNFLAPSTAMPPTADEVISAIDHATHSLR